MRQLTQNLRSGLMELQEVPVPAVGPGTLLIRNCFSVISAGTEGKRVTDARRGWIGKATARKEEVRRVVDTAVEIGLRPTYDLVMSKLDTPASLGYSSAGEVVAVGPGNSRFKVGDRVACGGGQYAVHAEVVAVPENLCALIPDNVGFDQAAYTTIGAIALQGVRQADLRLGESCVVIGLGLLGQLTVLILQAAGVKVIGIDIDNEKVELARKIGDTVAVTRNSPGLTTLVEEMTGGYGSDAVIITASTKSLDPVELAGQLCRPKGTVVVVGAVPTGFSRANYYNKELQLRMSCSYGPGRYDTAYEEKGLDYPIGYVRWTENRNMGAFLDLLGSGAIEIDALTSHRFKFEQALDAYELIVSKREPFLGVVLEYDGSAGLERQVVISDVRAKPEEPAVGFIGAGSFAQKHLLPSVASRATLVGVATARGTSAKHIADKYGFAFAATDGNDVATDPRINTVFIATRHDLHAEFVIRCLQEGKNVFVEKPLCMTSGELEEIGRLYGESKSRLMVGFNRRFAPMVAALRSALPGDLPRAINYRISANKLPDNHWTLDPEIGGGRIIGEVCHFVDLASHLAGAPPTWVSATAVRADRSRIDTAVISLKFANESVATISYFANGSKKVPKEYLEVFCGGITAILDDFKKLTVITDGKTNITKGKQDKGHKSEVQSFLASVRDGTEAPIPFQEIYMSTLATFGILESIESLESKRLS